MRRIYLDNAAATPVCEGALRAMTATAKKFAGNPSAIHKEGRMVRAVLEGARAEIAKELVAHPDEVIFTSGATESNNMALQCVIRAAHARGVARPHIIISAIEHPSVLETVRSLAGEAVRVEILPVDGRGLVNLRELRKLITPETVLVSVMYANNEIGTIEPIADIAKEIRHARKLNGNAYPYFHTDAAQAANYLDLNVARLGVDMMTLSSGKTYGPRGVGALFVKRGVKLNPLMHGGEHEGGRRPGTESVALAVGFATALAEARRVSAKEFKRIQKLRDTLASKILKKVSGTSVNGLLEHIELQNSTLPRYCEVRSNPAPIDCHVGVPPRNDGKHDLIFQNMHSLPNILNISIDGVESDALVLYLDAVGVAVSGKSACKSGSSESSHVILAVGGKGEGVVRFSLGRETVSADVIHVIKELARIVPLLRNVRTQSDAI
ncbi:MAG: cysteine desulfurase family protein [Patescibacteria group bacterium]